MPDTPKFVVNDRRKFTAEGELRPDAVSTESSASAQTQDPKGPQLVSSAQTPDAPVRDSDVGAQPSAEGHELHDRPELDAVGPLGQDTTTGNSAESEPFPDDALGPAPTDEQTAEVTRAYDATVDRLDTALRAADPGGERIPEMTFERLTQSLYTQALMLLGGGTQPGEQPRVDIIGARQTIDMLAVIAEKSKGNLTPDEDKLLESALFDLRMGFLEITQALTRQAAQRQGSGAGISGAGSLPGAGPRIVR